MSEPQKNTQTKPSKVLIVEDDPQSAELVQAYLEAVECEVGFAVNGVEAIEKVNASPPDIILLDVMMPKMSGFEVCKRLKGNPDTKDIPIIIVTALNEMGDIERGIDCGADDFLSKPINKLELITRVKSLLRVRNLKSELERTLSYLSELEKDQSPDGIDL